MTLPSLVMGQSKFCRSRIKRLSGSMLMGTPGNKLLVNVLAKTQDGLRKHLSGLGSSSKHNPESSKVSL